MPIPNKTGGPVHCERTVSVGLNQDGTSRAKYAGKPNEPGWIHEDEEYKGASARQCAAEDFFYRYCIECDTEYHMAKKVCPECGSEEYYFKRCEEPAEPGKATCRRHGGNFVQTKEGLDKARRGAITTGITVNEIMLCPCSLHGDSCPFANQLVDVERYGSSVPRCLPEQELFDSIIEKFRSEYELDDVADLMMLNRLAMTMVRLMRGEKIIAKYGEITERTRTSPDGSYESWYEQSAVARTVDSLDRRLQAWLKELAISKAAREGKKISVEVHDLTAILSAKTSQQEIIDVHFDDVSESEDSEE